MFYESKRSFNNQPIKRKYINFNNMFQIEKNNFYIRKTLKEQVIYF